MRSDECAVTYEEVMMLMKESPVKGDEGLPLVVAQFASRGRSLGDDLDALLLNHDEPRIDSLDFIDELLSSDRSSVWLKQHRRVAFGRVLTTTLIIRGV